MLPSGDIDRLYECADRFDGEVALLPFGARLLARRRFM